MKWHAIETFPEDKSTSPPYDAIFEPSRWFNSTVTALRLVNAGIVGLYPFEEVFFKGDHTVAQLAPRSTNSQGSDYQLTVSADVKPYRISINEVDLLKQLVHAVRSIKSTALLVALSRFNSLYSRTQLVDRIIDAVIAIEALYLDDVKTELQYRLGLRVATHLGEGNPEKREWLINLVRTTYDIRSKAAHGAAYKDHELNKSKSLRKSNWKNVEELLEDLTGVLRSALRAIFLQVTQDNFELFHKKLDEAIRRGESQIEL